MAAKRAVMQTSVALWRSSALAKAFMPWQAAITHSHDLEALLASYIGEQSILEYPCVSSTDRTDLHEA